MKPIHVLSRAVIISDNHLLLCATVEPAPLFYFLPGGHIEPGESAIVALKRELQEEAGITIAVDRFLGCFEYTFHDASGKACHSHEYNFIFSTHSPTLNPTLPVPSLERHIRYEWVALNKLENIDLKPEQFKRLIPYWLNLDMNNALKSSL